MIWKPNDGDRFSSRKAVSRQAQSPDTQALKWKSSKQPSPAYLPPLLLLPAAEASKEAFFGIARTRRSAAHQFVESLGIAYDMTSRASQRGFTSSCTNSKKSLGKEFEAGDSYLPRTASDLFLDIDASDTSDCLQSASAVRARKLIEAQAHAPCHESGACCRRYARKKG